MVGRAAGDVPVKAATLFLERTFPSVGTVGSEPVVHGAPLG